MPAPLYYTKYPLHIALSQEVANKPRRGWNETDPKFRHRAVMALFTDIDSGTPRKDLEILFRTDYLPGQPPFFLIQSNITPEHLPLGVETIERNQPEYAPGTPIRFRLSINAIRRKTTSDPATPDKSRIITAPVPFDTNSDSPQNSSESTTITPWLCNKFGGVLDDVTILNHQRELLGVDRNGHATSSLTVQVDTIDGVATVTDGKLLNDTIRHGIGRAKSYGCGLLSVQELQ
ncbi:CRISPR-associated protein Cas6/Cse3/CasE, subtype I-E/ECOLI [Arcanobacterium haemolyticum]|uniref:type I-E CRISPR-associated protein Cas6/Cse3/CasE n=1 Tax=Arcanobacterium haemolyticum TaxID=28264 RepID=UPI000D9DF45E|nr:type I-E CRISPR-associated protein Cas6/Cse3/CasE [Arcanobacterium haemolyticum]SPT75706.1 CRISPR-associated protein Cas6/Cse3/CasE, subtype I-E/ECOLI [Arcanobacterium haemolyticum]